MIKKILIFTAVLFILIIAVVLGAYWYVKPDKDKVLNFILENPDKASIYLTRNDSLVIAQNEHRMVPLASTLKIIIAIEYAEQAAKGNINPDSLIYFGALEKFHVPNTDGGAHSKWKESFDKNQNTDKVTIRDIAKGMIKYSSNANTEWMIAFIGLENINQRIELLGIQNHDPIYYLLASLFIAREAFPNLEGDDLVNALAEMSLNEYRDHAHNIHIKLNEDTLFKKDISHLEMDVQKVWSDKLPKSTVFEYARLMQKINCRCFFSPETHSYLNEVMEYVMENPKNQEWLQHSGTKGGSTMFLLTKALYATDTDGNTTEMAYFLNDISFLQTMRLQMSMNEFELSVLRGESDF